MERAFEGLGDDASTSSGVTVFDGLDEIEDSLLRTDQGHAATGDDTLFDGGLGGRNSIFDAVLLFLELNLGCSADLEHGHAAAQLGETLLELFAVVVAVGVVDLTLDLGDATLDVGLLAGAFDDEGLVLGDDDLAGRTQHLEANGLELEADLFADDLTTGEDGHVLQHRLAAIAEARSLDGDRVEGAADLVDDERRERFAFDVLADDHERATRLHDLFEHGNDVANGADLGADEQQVWVVEDGFHTLGIGHHVGRQEALVEAHALDEVHVHAEGLALFDGDDTVLADLVDGGADGVTDLVVSSGDRSDLCDLLLVLDLLSHLLDRGDCGLDTLLDATLDRHRVGAGGDVAQSLAHHRPGENRCGRRAVTGDVVGLLGDFLDELGADALEWILEVDLLRDGNTIVGDRGGAPLLVEDDVAALGAKRHADRVGQRVHSGLK